MLLELQIQDFALIDYLKLDFSEGLNILTGETGAGKSIIIDSVNFVLGERSSKDIIRTGSDKSSVEAVFENIDNQELSKEMESFGIDCDEDVIILSRELNQSGRSICRINGKVVTTSVLKSIGNYLIDIHGQHEHQSLLDEDSHIDMLDIFGGNELNKLKIEVRQVYFKVVDIKHELEAQMGDDRERERKLDLLNFQVKEIDAAKLRIGEEEDLLKHKVILNNANKLFTVLSNAYNILYQSEEGQPIFDELGKILSELHSITNIDDKLLDIYKIVENSYYLLEEAILEVRNYRDKIDFNPELIDEVEMRLDTISRLKRKYGSTVKDVLEYREKKYKEIQDIINSEEIIAVLKEHLKKESEQLYILSKHLSDIRKKVGDKLQKDIINELKFLGMEKSKFKVNFTISKNDGQVSFNEKGMDIITFLISTNPGEPEKPLARIASGGEISRIMLALKTVLAHSDRIPSLIFDEIDTGISGRAAQAVAEKLGQISANHQVICVTHLPQIASMAGTHFYISKSTTSGKTNTKVLKLYGDKRVMEVARMLGGAKLTDLTLKHAEEMISIAQNIKKKITD